MTGYTNVLLATVMFLGSGLWTNQELTLLEVLSRSTESVNTLHVQLQGVVMEERYEQRVSSRGTGGFGGFQSDGYERITLRSDYLLVQPEGAERHFGFRDVFETDGRPVRDREDRLTRLFLSDTPSAERQIQGILSESARYNLGDIERTINTPTLALLFLSSDYKPRFSFKRAVRESPSLGMEFQEMDNAEDVWVVEYVETWPWTVVSGRNGRNMPAQGRFWIESRTGGVLMSEVRFEAREFNATIVVAYEFNSELGHAVPTEMRERYQTRSGSRIDGTATYSDVRRFEVQVDVAEPFRE